MKFYCVVYLSEGGMHYRYRCYAKNKREVRKLCRESMGIANKNIVEIYEEKYWHMIWCMLYYTCKQTTSTTKEVENDRD